MVVVLAVLLAACGGDPSTDPANDGTAANGSQNGTGDGTTGDGVEEAALPPPGPVDVVFPSDEDAYRLLADGRCDELRDEVATWGADVVEFHGQDTIELYRTAAHVCLREWDAALEAFDRIRGPPDALENCARAEVFAWLQRLVEARRADPSFEPQLVPSTGASACPVEPTDDATGDVDDVDENGEPTDDGTGDDAT